MNQRGQSREQYEDDILAFLMDGMLEEEGWALLEENERLNADPDAAIPAGLDERCRALLQSAFPDKPMKKPERVTWKILKRVLIAAVLAATMFATAYAAVPEFRAGVLRIITNVTDFGTEFFFRSTDAETPASTLPGSLIIKDGMPFEFSYVPEGYEQVVREVHDWEANGTMYLQIYGYPNDDPNNFTFRISTISEGTGLSVDTEDAVITNVQIHGFDGQLIRKIDALSGRECVSYLWFDLENRLMYFYDSVGVPFEESQRIFDGIVIYGYEADTPTRTPAPTSPLVIKDGMPFEFSYVPDGYEQAMWEAYDRGANGTMYEGEYCYPYDDPNHFGFRISPILEGTVLSVDTEDATITYMKIRGFDGQLIQKTDVLPGRERITYLWFDLENCLMYRYNSIGIPFEESQRIFDGIVIYGYEADTPAPTPAPTSPLVIKDGMPFEFSYVPDGYAVFQKLSSESGEDNIWYSSFYVDKHDDVNNFSMEVFSVDESSAGVIDTENATIQNVVIHGHDGMAIHKIDALTQRNQVQYVWLDGENKLFYSYFSLGISSEESQKIFDGIVIYE